MAQSRAIWAGASRISLEQAPNRTHIRRGWLLQLPACPKQRQHRHRRPKACGRGALSHGGARGAPGIVFSLVHRIGRFQRRPGRREARLGVVSGDSVLPSPCCRRPSAKWARSSGSIAPRVGARPRCAPCGLCGAAQRLQEQGGLPAGWWPGVPTQCLVVFSALQATASSPPRSRRMRSLSTRCAASSLQQAAVARPPAPAGGARQPLAHPRAATLRVAPPAAAAAAEQHRDDRLPQPEGGGGC